MWYNFSENPTRSGEYLCCYLRENEKPYYLFHKYNKEHECWIDLMNPSRSKPNKWMRIPEQCETMIKAIFDQPLKGLTNREILEKLDYISLLDSYITYFKTGKIVLGNWRKRVNTNDNLV